MNHLTFKSLTPEIEDEFKKLFSEKNGEGVESKVSLIDEALNKCLSQLFCEASNSKDVEQVGQIGVAISAVNTLREMINGNLIGLNAV